MLTGRKVTSAYSALMRRWYVPIGLAIACVALAPTTAHADAIEDAAGHVVLVDFWASWCAPCRRSFPWMNSMQRKYSSQGLKIIAVNVDTERSAANEFLKETPAEFAIEFDPVGLLAEKFDVQAMPSSFLLDESGNIVHSHLGFKLADTESYERAIRDALAEKNARNDSQ